MKKNVNGPLWVWRRQIAEAHAEQWLEQLEWVGPQRVMVLARPGSIRARLEVYGSHRREADRLLKEYGGRVRAVAKKELLPPAPSRPIRANRSLYVVGDSKSVQTLKKKVPAARILLIPASMAFGSGEHATTGMVLRYLGKSKKLVHDAQALDLGTGSGILALAARALGARRVVAMDNCPDCIRISRENEKSNFGDSQIRWHRAELGAFDPKAVFSLVTANLFSDLLIGQSASIWKCLAPGGTLLLSGILHPQAAGVVRAYRAQGGKLICQQRKGKWVLLAFARKT